MDVALRKLRVQLVLPVEVLAVCILRGTLDCGFFCGVL